jgi:hypothetical protein
MQWVPGTLSAGAKGPEGEADHSPPAIRQYEEKVDLYIHYPTCSHDSVASVRVELYR